MPPEAPSQDAPRPDADVQDLHKGALANLAGHAARFAQPVLLLVAARLYGAAEWGLFVAGQAAYQLLAKASLLGLERGMVFWIPRATKAGGSLGIRAAATRVAGAALALAVVAAAVAPWLAARKNDSAATWVLMALGLVPLALTELLVFATVGRRRMDVQVAVRDVLVPIATLGLAVGLRLAGAGPWGLGVAFAVGNLIGFAAVVRASLQIFGARAVLLDAAPMPEELRRFALPQWGSELAMALLLTLDRLVLEAFAPRAVVGAYGVALQFGNTIRSLRGTFDPLVSAVASSIALDGAKKDRLDQAIGYAIRVVMLLQAPVAALFLFLGAPLLAFFGADFGTAFGAVVVFGIGWTLHGTLGLAAPVLAGFGESRPLFVSTLFALGLEVVLLFALVPPLGATGAALGLLGAYLAQAVLLVFVLARRLGRVPALGALVMPLRVVGLAMAAGAVAAVVGEALHRGAGPFAGFAGFALLFLPQALPALRPDRGAAQAP